MCVCVCQRVKHGQEEAAHLSHSGLWEGVREDVSPAGAPALALRGAAVRLQLDVLRQEVHTQRRAAETPENTHGYTPLPLSHTLHVFSGVYEASGRLRDSLSMGARK